jgi:hypothetical protein
MDRGNSEGMTKQELRQIYSLNREIKMWKRELVELECKSLVGAQIITGMPRGGDGEGNNIESLVIEKERIQNIIKDLIFKVQEQRENILEYINTIDDSMMRQIIFYRHVLCYSWTKIAIEMGGGNTADGIRIMHDRFIKKM